MQKTISISSTGKLMWGGIFIIKKEYDSRKYLGYIYLLISLGLMLQTVIQGNIPVESRVKMCIAGYVATLVVGFLVGLYATRKIIVKNKFVKEPPFSISQKPVSFIFGFEFLIMNKYVEKGYNYGIIMA